MKPLFVMFVSPPFTYYKQIKVYIYNTGKKEERIEGKWQGRHLQGAESFDKKLSQRYRW